jgi:hypothetical protein
MAAVGTGVANVLVAAVLVATAASKIDGVLPRWQFSHVVDVGKCWVDAAGPVVGGMTTIESVPWNGPVPLTWQVLQPLITPLWLYLPPAKLVVVVVRPVRLSTWHDSQPSLAMAMWLVAGFTKGLLAIPGSRLKVSALVALWHCAQLVVADWAYLWMLALVGMTEKSATVWQLPQLVPVT